MRRPARALAGCCAGGRFPQTLFCMGFAKNRLTAVQIDARLASGSVVQPGKGIGAVMIGLCDLSTSS